MKYTVLVVLSCALSACGGSGSTPTSMNAPSPAVTSTILSPTAAPTLSLTPSTTPSLSPTAPSTVDNLSFGGLLNNVRTANNAAPVTYDSRLGSAAQLHANDMLANNYNSHTGLDGSSAGDRITAAGYKWRTYGENIAWGYRDQAGVLQGWVKSPGHQQNNINPKFEEFGLGKAGSGNDTKWVLVLATEQ